MMNTPQQNQKGPRRSARKNKNAIPNGQPVRAVASDNELAHSQQTSGAESNGHVFQGRKALQGHKPENHYATMSDSNEPHAKSKATPIKQAYAGPTFHQSPAASALPMPSFYSKSVPNVSSILPPQSIDGLGEESDVGAETPSKRESTPLDWIFDRARQSQTTPRGRSPDVQHGNQPFNGGSSARGSPAPKDAGSVFPFELDSSSMPGDDANSFATPYKEQMDLLKSTRSTSDGVRSMDERERKAKTDALKKLLLKSPQSQASNGPDQNNPFNARAPQVRPRSGPSTPNHTNGYAGPHQSSQYFPNMPRKQHGDMSYNSQFRQPSNLRNIYGGLTEPEAAELSSDAPISPPRISTVRCPARQPVPPAHGGPTPVSTANTNHTAKASTAHLEDDLRRMLNLDVASKGCITDKRAAS